MNIARSSRLAPAALFLLVASGAGVVGCSLLVEFDSTKIGADASVGGDSGDATPEASPDATPDAIEAGDAGCSGPSDCPAPTSDCFSRTCTAGVCGTAPVSAGATCASSGGKVCDGAGACVACNAPTDCPAPTTTCQTAATCAAHACGFTFAAKGSVCSDGGGVVCDGAGTCVAAHCTDGVKDADESDQDCGGATCAKCIVGKACVGVGDCVAATTGCGGGSFTSPNTCTGNVCTAHVTACTGTTNLCDATAGCVQCLAPTDCPTSTNECVVPTCSAAHACATTNLDASHTYSTGQTPGNCQKIVCNGAGATTTADDPTDLPTATTVCKIDPACTGTPLAPSFTPAPAGTDCTADLVAGKTKCGDGTAAGTCVECNVDADCTAPATCQAHACL